jgi:hypothetical protein
VGLSAIARESFEVRLWLRRLNLGLEKGERAFALIMATSSAAYAIVGSEKNCRYE